MKNRTDLINYLIEIKQCRSYLEIGVCRKHHNFDHIKVERKICVDPDPAAEATFMMTSDAFFEKIKGSLNVDMVFIDGLHHSDQVQRDFENSLSILSIGGVIVLHDCNPPSVETTCVPRGSQREWCGDVYKFACRLNEYHGFNFMTVNFDYGCCIVLPSESRKHIPIDSKREITWEIFQNEKRELLNLVSPEDFIKMTKHLNNSING